LCMPNNRITQNAGQCHYYTGAPVELSSGRLSSQIGDSGHWHRESDAIPAHEKKLSTRHGAVTTVWLPFLHQPEHFNVFGMRAWL